MARRVLRLVVVSALAIGLATPAIAAPRAKASITADGVNPHAAFGQDVVFEVNSRSAYPWVNARCHQDGEQVYSQWHGLFDSYRWEPVFTLGPTPSWTGGDADCVAEVGHFARNGRFRVEAEMTFAVLG